MLSAEKQLAGFLAKFTPAVAKQAKAAVSKMRKLLPGAIVLVYDNYNALAIGFCGTERTSEIICSIAVYPRWVSLFLVGGPRLHDPEKLLRGSGTVVRHIVLSDPSDLDKRAVRALLDQAVKLGVKIDASKRGRIVIKSVSAKQRPRRPA